MNFIEQLKSVGGIKPCDCGVNGIGWHHEPGVCAHCHGTGQILDLAPLLAKPKELEKVVPELFEKAGLWKVLMELGGCKDYKKEKLQRLHVVGPQRASNLVFECARQLGGTAVTCFDHDAETKHNLNAWANCECTCPACKRDMLSFVASYRLLPIPDNATCLFVTDRLEDPQEVCDIASLLFSVTDQTFPYILALVSSVSQVNRYTVVALHQENS